MEVLHNARTLFGWAWVCGQSTCPDAPTQTRCAGWWSRTDM